MATIKRGLLGGFSGKVANIVGGSWKGIATMRSLPLSVANPNTAAQSAQRTKFSATVAFAKNWLTNIVKPLWDRFAVQASGYNDFVSVNIANFNSAGVPTYANIVISQGTLTSPTPTLANASEATQTVDVEWTDTSGVGLNLATDKAYVAIYNETKDSFSSEAAGADRNTELVVVPLPVGTEELDVIHVYLAFRRADGTLVSNTGYVTGAVGA